MPLDGITFQNTPYGANIDWGNVKLDDKWATDVSSLGLAPINEPVNWNSIDNGFWSNVKPTDFSVASPSFGAPTSTTPSKDPFNGLANFFKSPGALGASSLPGAFNVAQTVAGSMAVRDIGDSWRRMADAGWQEWGNQKREENILRDLFEIAPYAREQASNLDARDRIEQGAAQAGWMAKQDRIAGRAGMMNPLSRLIPKGLAGNTNQMLG